jgi:hypothetical protein
MPLIPVPTKRGKREEVRAALPEDLQPMFDKLLVDYQSASMTHHRQPFISYVVLADLVREGWRRDDVP